MSSGFIAVAVAHDYTCPKGDEWLFHGIPKASDANFKPGQPMENPTPVDKSDIGFLEIFLWVLGLFIIGGFLAFSLWLIIGF